MKSSSDCSMEWISGSHSSAQVGPPPTEAPSRIPEARRAVSIRSRRLRAADRPLPSLFEGEGLGERVQGTIITRRRSQQATSVTRSAPLGDTLGSYRHRIARRRRARIIAGRSETALVGNRTGLNHREGEGLNSIGAGAIL